MRSFRFVKSVISRMKQRYGQSVVLSRTTNIGSTDFTTGLTTGNVVSTKSIKRAIILPEKLKRSYTYDAAYISANRNFTYGGFYDASQRVMLFDNDDIGNFVVDVDTNVMFGNKTYNIKEAVNYEENNLTKVIIVACKGDR